MKFLSMEDETGTFEVTLFPKAYRRFGGSVDGRGPYLVWARVEADAGSLNLTAERLERAISD
jgi:DNA polymerase III alpha subunit